MNKVLNITSTQAQPELLDLPWDLPLNQWPENIIVAIPRGISRHVVRFVNLHGEIIAIKEIGSSVALHEYETLRSLNHLHTPCVEPFAVVNNRFDKQGNPLNTALITRHLAYSLPYRAVFGQSAIRPETVNRLIDALTVLIVRLHLIGFFWGDVSLSNTLFRRDAGEFAAYLVDAETGALYEQLSANKREYDVELARTNIIGELLDLQAGGIIDAEFDALTIGNHFAHRYNTLWNELTSKESFSLTERWRINSRIQRLNELGFEVGELTMTADINGTTLSIQPKVVDAGHYSRKIMRLTGLDVEEKQARRMINDMEQYRAVIGKSDVPLEIIAHEWMSKIYEPTVRAIPHELQVNLEPAQIFHEVLEHRWFIAENAGHDFSMRDAVNSYIEHVLKKRPHESHIWDRDEIEMEDFIEDDWSGYLA